MIKSFLAAIAAGFFVAGGALAQSCPAFTYTFTNGSTADATQVMANFNTVRNCANSLGSPRDYIAGLTLSTAGSSTIFGVAQGQATDSTNVGTMNLASSYTKTTAGWAVGSGNGALDVGTAAANTWYHVFLIQRTDTGVVDLLISLSPTSPTLPSSYSLFRRIGSMKTDGSSQWIKFFQNGDDFSWDVPTSDHNAADIPSSSGLLITLNVPTGVRVTAFGMGGYGTGSGINFIVTSPDTADVVAYGLIGSPSNSQLSVPSSQRTNASAQVRVRGSTTNTYYQWTTLGWTDQRGKNN